jgi:transcriptional regulator with XRE-family HTH domain
MASRIGSDLRRARTRREIDLGEVEAATRIRVRYLSAIENEEWDVLPGGFYTRGFIRTYASYLGLDGDRLAEDFKREVEGTSPSPARDAPAGSPNRKPAGTGRELRRPQLGWLALAAVLAVGAFAILVIPSGNGGGGEGTAVQPAPRPNTGAETSSGGQQVPKPHPGSVSMSLVADAEVWACVLSGDGRKLVDGQILQAGEEAGSFRSGSFIVSFGNGEVTMTIDGKRTEIPPTASPVGYTIDAEGTLAQLNESERPTCE